MSRFRRNKNSCCRKSTEKSPNSSVEHTNRHDWKNSYLQVSRHNGNSVKGPLKPLKPLNTIVLWSTGFFKGALNWAPMIPRDASLPESYTSDRCSFSSQNRVMKFCLAGNYPVWDFRSKNFSVMIRIFFSYHHRKINPVHLTIFFPREFFLIFFLTFYFIFKFQQEKLSLWVAWGSLRPHKWQSGATPHAPSAPQGHSGASSLHPQSTPSTW